MIHVAILRPRYLRAVLDGAKTVEARLTRVRIPPFDAVRPGERVFLKRAGGAYAAVARARRVDQFDRLSPQRVRTLRDRWNHLVHADDAYWDGAADARYATFIWLTDIAPTDHGPTLRSSNRRGWVCLDQETAAA